MSGDIFDLYPQELEAELKWVDLKDVVGKPANVEFTIEDLDAVYEKLVGRRWDSWPPLVMPRFHRCHEYLPLDMWDVT